MQVTGYKLQARKELSLQPHLLGQALKHAACNCILPVFQGKSTQIFKATEMNREFYLRKRYRQR
jgi:hypothetical protein